MRLLNQKPRLTLFLLAHKLQNFSRNRRNCCKLSVLEISFSFSTDIYHLLLNIDICVSNILVRDDNLTQNSLFFPLSDPGGLISSLQQLSLITELIGTWKSTHNSSLCAVNYCKTMTAVSSMEGPKNTFQIPHPATVFHPIPPSRRSKHLHPDLAWLNPSRYISPSYFDRWK